MNPSLPPAHACHLKMQGTGQREWPQKEMNGGSKQQPGDDCCYSTSGYIMCLILDANTQIAYYI